MRILVGHKSQGTNLKSICMSITCVIKCKSAVKDYR